MAVDAPVRAIQPAGTTVAGPGYRRVAGKALGSWLAIIMLVGTLGYVVRDNFRVGLAAAEQGASSSEAESLSRQSAACLERGDVTMALEHARRAVQVEPDGLPGHLSLISALVATGDLEEARAVLLAAQRLGPEDAAVEFARQLLGRTQ